MIFIKLFLAHILGDFFLQPVSWVKEKEDKNWYSVRLFLHIVIHFGLVVLLLWDLSMWKVALFIASTHYLIDVIKLRRQTKNTRSFWFYTDQALHILVILSVWLFVENVAVPELTDNFWIISTGLLFLTMPASFLIQHIMNKWNGQIIMDKTDSLQGAGQYIGILERLFIYVSVLTGNLQMIGFLLAAKSVFRFGDLTRSKDRKLTEYILVGTLFSFILAIAIGMLALHLL